MDSDSKSPVGHTCKEYIRLIYRPLVQYMSGYLFYHEFDIIHTYNGFGMQLIYTKGRL